MINLEVTGLLEEEPGHFTEVEVTLPNFSRGITHHATVMKGECVVFSADDDALLVARIYDVAHEWKQADQDDSISVAYAQWESPLTEAELEFLLLLGFEQKVSV